VVPVMGMQASGAYTWLQIGYQQYIAGSVNGEPYVEWLS
jgi:hypothetical protein